jgi:hypothetical protein
MKRLTMSCLLLVLSACAHASFDAPAQFAVLDEQGVYAQRATSAHGVVIAVREVSAPEHTSLTFWHDAILQRMQGGQGYAFLAGRDVRAKSGQAGKLLTFGHDQNGRTFDYWVAVYADGKRVTLLEMGGHHDQFEKARPELEHALASLTLR